MRATRAYLASLGTTGLLVLAAFAILFTASALLAFNGWPGEESSERATPVLIDQGRDLAPGPGPAQVAAEAADVADDVALVPASSGGDGGVDPGSNGGDGTGPDDGGPGDGDPDGPGDRDPNDGTPDAPADPSPPDDDDTPRDNVSLTDGLADGVESTTDFLGENAASPVSPQLGQVVTDTGQALTDLVRALDGTAAPRR